MMMNVHSRKKTIKKAAACVMISVLVFICLCSCSKTKNNAEIIKADSLWYEAKKIEINPFLSDKDVEIRHTLFNYYDNKIRIVCQYYISPTDEELSSADFDESDCYGTSLYVFDTNGTLLKNIDIKNKIMSVVDRNARIRSFGFGEGQLYILSEYDNDHSEDVISILDINTENIVENMLCSNELMRAIRSCYSNELVLVTDDTFMICDDSSKVLLFDKTGNFRLDTFSELFKHDAFFWDSYSDHMGNVWFSCSNAEDYQNKISIELGSQIITYEIKNFVLDDASGVSLADNGSYYSIGNSGISKYNIETSSFNNIMPSDSFNVNLCDLIKLSVLSVTDDEIFLANINAVNPVDGIIAYKLTKADSNPNAGKSKMKIGLFGDYIFSPTLGTAIFEHNSMNASSYISVMVYDYKKKYFEDANSLEKERKAEAEVLMRDILDGNGPDIVINAFDILELCDERYLYDLNEFINHDSEYNPDDYVSTVIGLASTDNRLYQMPLKFSTNGLSAPNQYAPSNRIGYTFEEYEQMVSEANNGADCLNYQMDRSGYYSLLFTSVAGSLYNESEWILDSQEYRTLAMYCKERVSEKCLAKWDDEDFVMPNFTIKNPQIEGISSYIGQIVSSGCDLYGYPSLNGNHGVMISVVSSSAISSQSKNKEEAWRFIKLLMSYEIQSIEPVYSSINTNVLKKVGKEAIADHNKAVEKYKAMDSKELEKWKAMGNDIYTNEIDDSAIDSYLNLLSKATEIQRVDGQVLLITKEEIQAYYFNQKELVDVIEIMNNRIKVYKNEQG